MSREQSFLHKLITFSSLTIPDIMFLKKRKKKKFVSLIHLDKQKKG